MGSEFQGTGIDIWACGCIMAELLLHKPFLAGETEIDQVFFGKFYKSFKIYLIL